MLVTQYLSQPVQGENDPPHHNQTRALFLSVKWPHTLFSANAMSINQKQYEICTKYMQALRMWTAWWHMLCIQVCWHSLGRFWRILCGWRQGSSLIQSNGTHTYSTFNAKKNPLYCRTSPNQMLTVNFICVCDPSGHISLILLWVKFKDKNKLSVAVNST